LFDIAVFFSWDFADLDLLQLLSGINEYNGLQFLLLPIYAVMQCILKRAVSHNIIYCYFLSLVVSGFCLLPVHPVVFITVYISINGTV
jgi:hypothetical protein